MSDPGGNAVPRITKAEHIGPADTGDNIEAKRVANYAWDGTNWKRLATPLVTSPYDYVSVAYPDAVTEVYTFKTGGSGGTSVATVTVVYTDSTKANLSTVTRT